MFYGRVIGNELRDVPPECLPVWGQRWSGYRAPRGPSPFSTRIFTVDRMSEMGPALTSPTQFEAPLTDEDEGEDASSESSQLYGSFPSSPLTIQPDVAELASLPETLMPRSVHHSSTHPHSGLKMLHRNTGRPPPQNSTCFSTTFSPRQRFEQPVIQHHASEPLPYPPTLHHGVLIEGERGSFENDHTLWDMGWTSTNTEPLADLSHWGHVPSGQLQHTIPPHSISEWQFTGAHTQSLQPISSSHPESDHLSHLFRADDRTLLIPTPPPSSYHRFTLPLSQQNVGIDSSSSMIPGVAHSLNPTITQWPPGSVHSNPSFLGPLENSRSTLGPGVFCHLASDHHRNPPRRPEDSLSTFAHAEGCIVLPDKPMGD